MPPYEIPAPLLQAVIAYLAEHPFREVAGLMRELAHLSPVAPPEPAPSAPPPEPAPSAPPPEPAPSAPPPEA